MITDKCKTDFEKWLEEQPVAPYKAMFWDIPFTVQFAYLESFFDAANLFISIEYLEHLKQFGGKIKCMNKGLRIDLDLFRNREEVYKQAIIKANQIYNEQKSNN